MARTFFTPKLFAFLRQLAANNRRDWFLENKPRYVAAVQEPALAFCAAFVAPLRTLSPHMLADPRPVGGSLFRINRDTRFAADKSPYKTWIALQFRHKLGKDVHAPGFYLHLEPGRVFAGMGIWHPDAQALGKIRDALVADPAGWTRAIGGKRFQRQLALSGESLVRPPRGYDADHPLIEDLKRKDFIAVAQFTEADACSAGFLQQFTSACRAGSPLMRYLNEALELPY